FSSKIVSEALLRSLESQTPVRTIADMPVEQAIVVLGGYLHPPAGNNPTADLADASDRLVHGMRLFRAGKAPVILLTGGNIPFLGAVRMTEAAAARDLLREWGVPAESILLEERSRNTEENARYSYRILNAKGIRHILLVTSAFHMPRSLAVFRKAGFNSIPAPTDFRSGWGEPDLLFQLLPDSDNLSLSTTALKEWLGLGLYRLRGWT
ncbi:MAG: YdcF family protein, partial [Acidobacteriota bacterium]|nr:YdcF family protein [Acidobacteriota bacterium]